MAYVQAGSGSWTRGGGRWNGQAGRRNEKRNKCYRLLSAPLSTRYFGVVSSGFQVVVISVLDCGETLIKQDPIFNNYPAKSRGISSDT